MKYHTITDIDKDGFHELCKFLELEWEKEIIINSSGGEAHYANMMLREMKRHSNISIVWFCLYSSAFILFNYAVCKKYLIDGAVWMIHKASIDWMVINQDWEINAEDSKNSIESLKQMQQLDFKFFTVKEKRSYDSWCDVYFEFNRLKKIFPNAEVIYL